MSKQDPILTRRQTIGAVAVLVLLGLFFAGLHFLPFPSSGRYDPYVAWQQDTTRTNKKRHTLHYYDSIHTVRRDSVYHVYQLFWDSIHQADRVWWDSVRHADSMRWDSARPLRPVKKDTILDLNSVDTTELQFIRGIGSVTARRIVRYRERLGGFADVRQLQDEEFYQDAYGRVKSGHYILPDSVLNAFVVTIDSIRPIVVNRASVDRLQKHPYISYTLAQEIYGERRTNIRLKRMDDLLALPHMTDSLATRLAPYLSFE